MYKAILFDMDGTLLPMDMDVFIRAYFYELAAKLTAHGYKRDELVDGVWKGTGAMMKNDGEKSNEEVFWQTFEEYCGERVVKDRALFDAFYENDFESIRDVCGFDPTAAQAVEAAGESGAALVLASNPVFPLSAQKNRLRWAGVDPGKFCFITSYENCRFCKPDPRYYKDIADRLEVSPDDCLMIGNDVDEDMCASSLGMDVFLVTNFVLNRNDADISAYRRGTLADLARFLREQ